MDCDDMAEKKGRKNKYFTHVQPHLSEIEKWCNSLDESAIAKRLGISKTSWFQYKLDFPELAECVKRGRQDLVSDLRSSLLKRARGYYYTETKETRENGELVKTEISKKYQPPDVAALNLALKNYDKENWANDPQMLEIRKKELELRERQIENNEW